MKCPSPLVAAMVFSSMRHKSYHWAAFILSFVMPSKKVMVIEYFAAGAIFCQYLRVVVERIILLPMSTVVTSIIITIAWE